MSEDALESQLVKCLSADHHLITGKAITHFKKWGYFLGAVRYHTETGV